MHFKPVSLFAVAVCCLAGCSKTIEVTRYPSFYTPDLKVVAVLPFDNETLHPGAGRYIAERLAKSLRDNGTYQVLGPRRLAARMGGEQFKKLDPADRQAAVKLLRKLDDVQAFITGTVTNFTSAGYTYRWSDRGYGHPWYVHDPYWYYPINFYAHNEGRVSARASLVLVSEGAILPETSLSAGKTVFSDGDPPHLTRDECLVKAAMHTVERIVGRFAIVRKRVKIPLGRALRTAAGKKDGKWRFTDDFNADDEGIHAVVSLPSECGRNSFRLEVKAKGDSKALISSQFVWSEDAKEYEAVFRPEKLVGRGGANANAKKFVITLYYGAEPIKSRKITVK